MKLKQLAMLLIATMFTLNSAQANDNLKWDFDHQVQYYQQRLSENVVRLSVIPNSKTRFVRMSAFLIRQAEKLCKSKPFSLRNIEGVQTFDSMKAEPNRITPTLKADVHCSA
ncbi:hypothetical protein [Thalassotalea agarivorans]|uniref:Uncharacterized protein n=1 Tax=Thalassotalea agarivorans TaxID=349064 RepID=A0A1H9Y7F7_THASX|nr:hypothetical protein [Thalassotalea agarivorans]SES64294.1 hypothetical protein SAMN05660429_00091 [Thalassotalea agarivorans]